MAIIDLFGMYLRFLVSIRAYGANQFWLSYLFVALSVFLSLFLPQVICTYQGSVMGPLKIFNVVWPMSS